MVDAPPYGAEPDPEFADRLERMLLQRLTAPAGPRSRPGAAQSDAPDRTNTDPDDQEGDIIMLETEDPTGHEPATPRRRSPGRWLLVAAAAAVFAVVGTLIVVAGDDDEDPVDTVTPPTTAAAPAPAAAQDVMEQNGMLEPGSYFIDPDGDDTTPLRVTYEVPEGWSSWFGAVKADDFGHTALSIITVPNVVTDGCRDHTPLDPPVGPTVDDLATALSQLAPFAVTAPPTDVTIDGYSGKHLQLTLPVDLPEDSAAENFHDFSGCVDGEVHSWISTHNEGSFYGYEAPGHTEEFWILDVEGTRLVLVKDASPDTSAQDLHEADAIFDTIQIEP